MNISSNYSMSYFNAANNHQKQNAYVSKAYSPDVVQITQNKNKTDKNVSFGGFFDFFKPKSEAPKFILDKTQPQQGESAHEIFSKTPLFDDVDKIQRTSSLHFRSEYMKKAIDSAESTKNYAENIISDFADGNVSLYQCESIDYTDNKNYKIKATGLGMKYVIAIKNGTVSQIIKTPDGNEEESYAFDEKGRCTYADNVYGTFSFKYDVEGIDSCYYKDKFGAGMDNYSYSKSKIDGSEKLVSSSDISGVKFIAQRNKAGKIEFYDKYFMMQNGIK